MKKKSEQDRAEREIQRICEGSEVLKDLEAKLKTAYMNQDRVTQLEEAALRAEQDKEMVDKIMRRIEEEDYHDYMDRANKIKKTKEVIEAYKQQRAEEVAAAQKAAKDEEDRILAYAQAKNAREATFKAAQDQKK